MTNEVTRRDLQALEASCIKRTADVNKRFNDVPSRESVDKVLDTVDKRFNDVPSKVSVDKLLAEHHKEREMLRIALTKRIDELQNDVTALKTAVSRLQQAR